LPFRDATLHLSDILAAIELISLFVGEMSFEAYASDLKTKSAVERQHRSSQKLRIDLGDDADRACPGPDWKGYMGMGNILRHAYHRVDDGVIWNTVKIDLPYLKAAVTAALDKRHR
jgi:uncharacterized protein with HEPN domain